MKFYRPIIDWGRNIFLRNFYGPVGPNSDCTVSFRISIMGYEHAIVVWGIKLNPYSCDGQKLEDVDLFECNFIWNLELGKLEVVDGGKTWPKEKSEEV